jgi:branched-subunit amino acid transport protein
MTVMPQLHAGASENDLGWNLPYALAGVVTATLTSRLVEKVSGGAA